MAFEDAKVMQARHAIFSWSCKSPLSQASKHGEKKMVELLIRAGAYLNPLTSAI
jgi:hypothetical protein